MANPAKPDPNRLIEGDPAAWVECRTAISVSANIVQRNGQTRTARVLWAIDQLRFYRGLSDLKYTDIVAFVPADNFKRVKNAIQRIIRTQSGDYEGITLCAAADLARHAVAFRIVDVEKGLTPAPASYVLFDTTPGKKVRHHNVIRRFNPTGYQKHIAEGGKPGNWTFERKAMLEGRTIKRYRPRKELP